MSQQSALALTILFVLVMLGFIFYQHPVLVTAPWAAAKHAYVWLLDGIGSIFGADTPNLSYVNRYLSQTSYADVPVTSLAKIEDRLYYYGSWVFVLFLVGMGLHLFSDKKKYTQAHTFESLLEQETTYWRFNRYLINNDPFKDSKDVRKGKFRQAELPYEYLENRHLLSKTEGAPEKIKREAAKKVFKPNLGSLITGIESFSETERIMLAIFLSVVYPEKGNIGSENAKGAPVKGKYIPEKMTRDYAIRGLSGDVSYYLNGEMDKSVYLNQVNEIISLCWDCPYVHRLLKRHAYTSTFLRGMLIDVKRKGTFQPGYYTWLKMLDRNLWFVLHSTGVPGNSPEFAKKENSPGTNMEVALAVRHYTCERIECRAVPEPAYSLLFDDIDNFLEKRFESLSEF